HSADHLAAALKDIHRSLFSSNVFDLILKTCLTLTGASRGLYITATAADAPLRVRAAVDVDGYPASAPSAFITSLCRGALENERVSTCNEAARLPERAKDGEAFRNCLVAPV